VVDVSGSFTSILRPGVISETEITALVGPIVSPKIPREDASQPSPGMSERHYAPRARVHLFPTLTDAHFHAVLLGKGQKIGVLCFHSIRLEGAREIVLPLDPRACAQQLYAALHALDEADVGLILIEEAPNGPQWTGVRDRLNRAAKA
jgi:L-threonylcarbamoyladenylate synthase